MTVNELEEIAESVKMYLLNVTVELSNDEIEHVLEYLSRFCDESLERVRSARG